MSKENATPQPKYEGGINDDKIDSIKQLPQNEQSEWVKGYVDWLLNSEMGEKIKEETLLSNLNLLKSKEVNINYDQLIEKIGTDEAKKPYIKALINDELKKDGVNNFIDAIAKKNPALLFESMSIEHSYNPDKKDRLYKRIKEVNPQYEGLACLGAQYNVPEVRNELTGIQKNQTVMEYLIENRNENTTKLKAYFPSTPKYDTNSDLYKTLLDSDLSVEYIATKIREAENKKAKNGKEIDFIDVMYNSPPKLAQKISEIAKEVQVQKGSSYRGIKDSLIKLKESFSHIRKGGINDKVLDNAFSGLTEKNKVRRIDTSVTFEAPTTSKASLITRFVETVRGNFATKPRPNTYNTNRSESRGIGKH